MPAVAAFDSGNLLAVATALHDRFPDKRIMIAGDDDHKLENNPGRVKALEAALAAHGMVVFPNSTPAQREKGLTDFNDLALENPRLAKHQLEEAVWRARQQSEEQTGEIGKGMLRMDWEARRREIPCNILKETPHRFLVRLGGGLSVARRPASEQKSGNLLAKGCCGAGYGAVNRVGAVRCQETYSSESWLLLDSPSERLFGHVASVMLRREKASLWFLVLA